MHSIRTKITALTLIAILISLLSFGIIGLYFVTEESDSMSADILNLACENKKESLDEFLNSIQQSVNMISNYAIDSMDDVALVEGGVLGASGKSVQPLPGRSDTQKRNLDRYIDEHLAMIESAFKSIANHTNGVSTCYYRINPEITTSAKGFYFTKRGSSDFQKLRLTEIESYDPNDMEHVGWYYVPLRQGRPSWLEPYYTANPGGWVMSYAVPMYKAGTFIGVIGMDMELDTLSKQMRDFESFKTGYFVLTDENGRIYYHPEFKIGTDPEEIAPKLKNILDNMDQDSYSHELIRYERDGVNWQLTYTTLTNGMKLAAVVEEDEVNSSLIKLTQVFLIGGVLILLLFVIITMLVMKKLTDPLGKLTTAAQKLAIGEYDAVLDYTGNDEVGVLTGSFSTMRDRIENQITELSTGKQELQDAVIASQAASRAKTIFLSNMSHEIRTPLNAIIGYSDLAEHHIDDRERVLDYIKKISMSSEHLLSLINEILDVSRVESGRMVLHDEEFDFRNLLLQINTMIASQCANKGLTFNPRIIDTVSRAFIGDEMKLKEVLINILSNAVKYTPFGGTIGFSVEQIASSQEMCTLRFIISDTGIGMSEEFLPKLFDTFSQESDSNPDQYGSTGLGMTITKNIVDMMDGEIQVRSTKGEGSTFTVILELKDAGKGVISDDTAFDGSEESGSETGGQDDEVGKANSLAGRRALIVEDMAINAELLGAVLEMKDMEHEWAENGRIAVDMFSGHPEHYYDAVLMDIRMPVMDGLEATRTIRALDRADAGTVPIIAMSANAFEEDKQQSLQAGMNAHLSKPVDTKRLFEMLSEFILQ